MTGACLFEAIYKQLDIKLPDQDKYSQYSLRKQCVVLLIREMRVSTVWMSFLFHVTYSFTHFGICISD